MYKPLAFLQQHDEYTDYEEWLTGVDGNQELVRVTLVQGGQPYLTTRTKADNDPILEEAFECGLTNIEAHGIIGGFLDYRDVLRRGNRSVPKRRDRGSLTRKHWTDFDGVDAPEWLDENSANMFCSLLNSYIPERWGKRGVRYHMLNRYPSGRLYFHLIGNPGEGE